ncbi:xanthine dehydrogenase family protein molybdopterin-binding subunit [Leucothrix mucor]|uniref:xanthine dehydrogenase family protein molybdopterin-binding subunit n=1 Tax=Leucothrix mucor TaxID=45248 RepID=UPI0003B7921A|nr:molybdopterin cofactor-binding domain-containing protein [Leucothrix mucor]
MSKLGTITRRTFLVASAAVAGGVVFGTYKYLQPVPNPLLETDDAAKPDFASLNPYIKIDQDGVTVITPRAEMGQGIHSALAMMVAEELDLDWKTIKTEHGPASNSYYVGIMMEAMAGHQYDHGKKATFIRELSHIPAKFMGLQLTGGSMSTPDGFIKMRSAGASARLALMLAAAQEWGVVATGLKTEDGFVINPANNEKLAYTELAVKAAAIEAPVEPPLRDPSQWRYIGKSMPRVDIPAKTTGTAEFASDVKREGMLHATVKMSPRFGAGIKSSDTRKAEAMPGVEKIIQLDNNGFAIIANNTWRAFKAANAIEVEWETASYPADTAGIMQTFEESFNTEPNGTFEEKGDVELIFADAGDLVTAEYRVPYLAHSTMEPMSAVAQVKDGRVDIWTGAQAPTGNRDAIADAAGLDASNVHIHTTYLGGGFGRRSENDFSMMAYKIAAQTNGKPVKVTWSREEDMQHDFYRPAAIARFKGVMGAKKPLAVDIKIASSSIFLSMSKRSSMPAMGSDPLIAEGTAGQPDAIENMRIRTYTPELDIPVGFWRSVGASYNGFLHESFMDELAASKELDPIQMRLAMFGDLAPPGNKVVEKVAQMAGWTGRKHENGSGCGFAYTLSFGAHTAQIIDVSMTDRGIKIDKVYCALDVGVAIDPRNIEAQIQSAVIYGLTSAISGEITFEDGKVVQSNFHDYPAMRMNEVPEIEVAILENNPKITGVGEPGTPPSIPALANAIFALTGTRIRELPMNKLVTFA